jgi:NAD(P)-dependent dehydrogenase (short-subunit alcohol dehydrogenase family)
VKTITEELCGHEFSSSTISRIVQKLDDGPADQRYIVPPDAWVKPRLGEAAAVLTAIEELQQTHDAAEYAAAARWYHCASAIMWLASDQSAKTTGHIIPVDGGLWEAYLR